MAFLGEPRSPCPSINLQKKIVPLFESVRLVETNHRRQLFEITISFFLTHSSSLCRMNPPLSAAPPALVCRAYAGIGIPLGVTLTFFFAGLAIFAMYLLSFLAINHGNNDESFYSLAHKAFPNHPAVCFIVDSLVLIKAAGVGCSYLVVVGDMLPEVVGGAPEWLGDYFFRSLSIIMAVVGHSEVAMNRTIFCCWGSGSMLEQMLCCCTGVFVKMTTIPCLSPHRFVVLGFVCVAGQFT